MYWQVVLFHKAALDVDPSFCMHTTNHDIGLTKHMYITMYCDAHT